MPYCVLIYIAGGVECREAIRSFFTGEGLWNFPILDNADALPNDSLPNDTLRLRLLSVGT